MLPRLAATQIERWLAEFPAVAILGPRQVGKTTLALEVAASLGPAGLYLDLETPSDLAKLGDAEAFFDSHADKLLILDEVQRFPGLFTVLRGAIDRRAAPGGAAACSCCSARLRVPCSRNRPRAWPAGWRLPN